MKYTFNDFEVKACYTGNKPAPWDNGRENWNHHTVLVKSTETGKRTSFDFWASIMNPHLSSEYDVLNAFYCFVSDAVSGLESFSDFCREFGYDEDSRSAEKIWKSCRRSYEKLSRMSGFSRDEIYDLCNALAEAYA